MHSFKTGMFAAAALLISTVSSQQRYYIVPETVPISDRRAWCVAQRSSCPLLCLQNTGASATTEANECDPVTLAYDCICGNGLTPNLTEFSQTMPYFLCTQYGIQCVNSCGGNTDCAYKCRADNPCGAQNPERVNVTTTSSAASGATAATSSGNVVFDGFGGSAATPTDSSNNSGGSSSSGSAMAIDLGRSYGLAVVLVGVFTGFALVL